MITIKSLRIQLFAVITLLFALATPTAWAQTGNWDTYKATAYASGSGTAADPYIINTAEQLAYFAYMVKNSTNYLGKYFQLGDNIDLSEHYWIPIGKATKDDNRNFRGVFDGKGYTISTMTVEWNCAESNDNGFGLFSWLGKGSNASSPATIRNLVLMNASFKKSSTVTNVKNDKGTFIAPLVGGVDNSNVCIENIIILNSEIKHLESFNFANRWMSIGGVAGKLIEKPSNYKFNNLYSHTDIDVSSFTGNKDRINVAGIVGEWQTDANNLPTNIFAAGAIKVQADIASNDAGTILGKGSSGKTLSNNVYYVHEVTDGAGNSLSSAMKQGTQKNNDYLSYFVNEVNSSSITDGTTLLKWTIDSKNRPYFKGHSLPTFFVKLGQSFSRLGKTAIVTLSGFEHDENTNITWTIGDKSITEIPDASLGANNLSLTVPLSTSARSGSVTVSKIIDGNTVTKTVSFTIPVLYYSLDLYADSYEKGTGTKDDPYIIKNDLQLARLAREVNNSSTKENFSGKYFELSQDIDLNSALWMPIGTWNNSTERYFYGKFNGKGHTISNMRIEWEGYKDKWCAWGLFSRIAGSATTQEGFGCITNLILQDAEIHKKAGYQPEGGGINIGIATGEVYANGELSNIIIRNSKITDNEETYNPGMSSNYRVGGIMGNIESGVASVFNLSSEVAINMFKNTTINSGNVNIAGGIGRINNGNQGNALNIYAANIYIHGPAIVTNNQPSNKWGAVVAFTNNPTTDNRGTWYYVNAISGTGTNSNYGTQKALADFAEEFVTANNKFSVDKAFDKKETWTYSSSTGFSFGNTSITINRGATDVATATTPGQDGTELYYWYLSTDQINWVKQTDANGEKIQSHTFTIPRKEYDQYVYAELVDGSSRSRNEYVEAIRVTVVLNEDKTTTPSTYSIQISTNVKVTDTGDDILKLLNVTYQWVLNGSEVGTNSSYTPPTTLTNSDKLKCHIKVSQENLVFVERDLFVSKTVVYIDPSNKDTTTEATRKNDKSWGYDKDHPMLTWEGAYSKLAPNASWDENVIVLMNLSNPETTKGFNLTNNTSGTNMLTQEEWKKTANSVFFRNTTISGKWDNTTYENAIIQMGGENAALPIWGDTRFENLSFQSSGKEYDILYCQYNNLEMGDGVKMLGYNKNSPGYGTIGTAYTTSFQVFGGINNDGRFHPLNTKDLNDKLEESLPHGKEGFKMVFKSGHYSTICVGGRQSGGTTHNGIMGTANMPIKCTIEMDINRTFNDESTSSTTKPDFDAGIIMAGNHEGAMYGDVDIIVKSGKVGRIVGGTLGNQREVNKELNPPYNTYMGRVNILLDPYQSRFYKEEENTATTNGRIMVTELYGGSCGRGFEKGKNVDNPFYGTSTVTINGGTFQRLEKDYTNENILCGIFGAGAGGMNGIGDGTSTNTTPDTRIAYWNGNVVNYGDYTTAKGKFAKYNCYNADTHTFTEVDPEQTSTKVIINGGVFGSSQYPIDGIYGGGSGYMAKGLWTDNAIPNVNGGNIYGKSGQTVASLTINGGEFYCKNGVFAGGRGTDDYYAKNNYGGTASAYTDLGKIFGNVEMNINGGEFYCPVFGGGYGVADAQCKDGTTGINTLSNMALITGQSRVNINGGTFYENVYGGGDMARIDNGTMDATMLSISDNADVRGSVFAGGNGREKRDASSTTIKDDTKSPELVGKVTGNANVFFYGNKTQSPQIWGDIFGGGSLAIVEGDARVNIYAGNFAGEIFGGGKGKLSEEDGTVQNSADILGNTFVSLAQDQGGQEEGENGQLQDNFSINVIWDKMWDGSIFKEWNEKNKTDFYDNGKFLNPHNIYGGGKDACVVGKYTDGALTNGTGTATVEVLKGMTPFSLLKTQEWKASYTDNANPHFYVFGGGYGSNTKVGSTKVTVNVEGEYGIYNAEITDDDDIEQLTKPVNPSLATRAGEASNTGETSNVFDNSKGIPNFTVLGVLGGGYAGTVFGNTNVTVDGMTFIHRVYGGGFGDPASTSDNTTGEVGGNTEVYVKGAKIYGDVFGGGAGVKPSSASTSAYKSIARVKGTTMVEVSDDAKVYGKVFGGGDIANVSAADGYTHVFTNKPTSESTLNQTTGAFESYNASNYKTFVNILGGDIFGEVFAGGKGLKKSELTDYANVGRVDGNTLLHIANTNSGYALDGQGNNIPYVWNRIYGGCSYGTVNGNTLVHVEGGMLGLNIFGGGYGDVPITDDQTNESLGQSTAQSTLLQVLGKKDTENKGTYANILGNTKVQIDGGSWIWNRKADINGNITTWTAAADANNKVLKDFNEFRNITMALIDADDAFETEEEKAVAMEKAQTILARIQNDESTKEFFDFSSRTFKKNHNIFGGGNRACYVGSYTGDVLNENTGEAIVELNHSPITDIFDDEGNTISLLDCTTIQGMCWYLSIYNVSSPQFSVFGAGYGANTKVGNTKVLAQPGSYLSKDGRDILQVNEKKYRYRNQGTDLEVYTAFEQDLYDYYKNNVTETEKKLHYGSIDGSGTDPNTYLRYRASRLAFSAGIPNFTFMNIHGGGFSGYVTGNTYVETDCQLACRNIFGGGLGSKPYLASGSYSTESGAYDFGKVGGSSKVFIKSGTISNNVYGGGAGVESVNQGNGTFFDFPDMARVTKGTKVHIYGEDIDYSDQHIIERTAIFGNVYGGGDVANVGTTAETTATKITNDDYKSQTYTSLVDIRGGVLMSQVFAGGNGRLKSECFDYTKLGAIYGNTYIASDKQYARYPYRTETSTGNYGESIDPSDDTYFNGTSSSSVKAAAAENGSRSTATGTAPSPSAYIWNRIFGGCQNGTVYGNTLVAINDGNIGHNIFGGGWGDVSVSAKAPEEMSITSADVKGNTNVLINGGNALLTSYWLPDTRDWVPAVEFKNQMYSPQYDPEARKFKINHNTYGGGNLACKVEVNTYITLTKGLLKKTTGVRPGDVTSAADYNFFASDEWKEIYNKVGSPHFAVFGGGYGENTNILGNTHIDANMTGYTEYPENITLVKGEEYKHFVSEYSVMDLVGGGYSGKVTGDTYVESNGLFCRRVFGGGFYNSVKNTNVDITVIDCQDIFGGGLMGDVENNTNVTIGTENATTNKELYVHGSIYGGNDVSGYVNIKLDKDGFFADNNGSGTKINILGGQIDGNVYGAGNGNYLYALDRKGNTKVTVNEHYRLNPDDPESEEFDLVYTVPMRESMPSYKSASDAAKIVNINSWRPLTNKVSINIKGNSTTDRTVIKGDVYGGGNSATVLKVYKNTGSTEPNVGSIDMNIGSHVQIGRVFMGCNGDELFTASEDNAFMTNFRKLNGDILGVRGDLNFSDKIDWLNDPSNKGISTLYLPTKNEDRPSVYPHLLDLYFQSVEMNIQGTIKWNNSVDGSGLTDCTIGTFCCGGNRGNMNVYPDGTGKIFAYTFPAGLTITDKIVGGCNNANYELQHSEYTVMHEGGYLLGKGHSESPAIELTILNQFKPTEDTENNAYIGGNVYGGCYESGTVRGDITLNLKSDMLKGCSKTKLENSNELMFYDIRYSALNVYGAGYGMNSFVYGNTIVKVAENTTCTAPTMDGDNFDTSTVSANFIYGGGQKGNVIGTTNVEVFNGHIFKSVTGGSYSGNVWGSTQVKVGYPKYYEVKQSGIYTLNRTDQKNKYIDREGGVETGALLPNLASETIKQTIYLVKKDLISQAVFDDIDGYIGVDPNGTKTALSDTEKTPTYFNLKSPGNPDWANTYIVIGEAVYGGGYSLADGSDNTTVLKFTEERNLNTYNTPSDLTESIGYGGNTTILIADSKEADKITISRQSMKKANVPTGRDLLGYYYYGNDNAYHYIYQAGKFYMDGNLPSNIHETDKDIYEYDNEGGIFGDGHLSYSEGFRSADLTGYGFATTSVNNPKIVNTFQRMDILRLEDNCFNLLGARDYATNATDKSPYSISRVTEIQMVAADITKTENDLKKVSVNATDLCKARNYMGLANNILYVGAIKSNVNFTDKYHDANGKQATKETTFTDTDKSYLGYKQYYIQNYGPNATSTGTDDESRAVNFQKRNSGTAANMIGIASGYALKIQNVQAIKQTDGSIKDNIYYGPIYGVVEMNLIDVREDEGGGYVYADNVHEPHDHNGSTGVVDFLETTGNFVFPYDDNDGRFIVDDCFPKGYVSSTEKENTVLPTAHYWYVTGYNYHYTAHITAYTSKQGEKRFYSKNDDGIMVLTGLKAEQTVKIAEWTMHSGHTDTDSYTCDLENRNYDFSATDNSGNPISTHNKENGKDVYNYGYELNIGAGNTTQYSDTEGFRATLSMNSNVPNYIHSELPVSLSDGDAKITFRLTDKVDNTSSEYFNAHLKEPCKGTVVLTAPALNGLQKPITAKVKVVNFYTNTGTESNPVYTMETTGTTLNSNGVYYFRNGETSVYTKIENAKIYTRSIDQSSGTVSYTSVSIENVTIGNTYYVETDRTYTYTIDLTIEYVQGPNIEGHINVENCALPGEMVRVNRKDVVNKSDQSFAINAYYWRMGKREKNSNGNWEFVDKTEWTKLTNTDEKDAPQATGYDIYIPGTNGTGLFKDCKYNKTEGFIDIPAYYFMNGYGIQLGVALNGLNDIFTVNMREEDQMVVHNYHRMDPGVTGVDLHLPEAIARASKESTFAEPRIYISDYNDMKAFTYFIQNVGKDNAQVKIGTEMVSVPQYGKNAQFVLQNNITIADGNYNGSNISDFAGTMHGNGHVISGIKAGNCFVNSISGNIYNLGLSAGKFSNSATSGQLHCCFEYEPTTGANPVVYRMNGTADTGYSRDDFRYGKVAYDLNEYYLRARYGNSSENDLTALKYVYDYYANGDYQYANRKDDITGKATGVTWLRTGQGSAAYPNYGNYETRHDKRHTIDQARAEDYVAEHTATAEEITAGKKEGEIIPESFSGTYKPLFNAVCHSGQSTNTDIMNDFLFWGQGIQSIPESYPSAIESRMTSEMLNRVYRTAGYYGNTSLSTFHYNAFSSGNRSMSTYVHIPTTTAVDFTCQHDKASAIGLNNGIWYAPVADNASVFKNIIVQPDVTRNLLIYTSPNDVNSTSDVYDALQNYKYDESTNEAKIKCHHITIDGSSAETQYLHLVERTPEGKDANGNECRNNDFCVPISFTVKNRAWYVRKPMYYANAATGSWEGICLPFTARKVVASLNGEITHFYGSSNLHHEYWLRGFTGINTTTSATTASATTEAKFQRPGTSSDLFTAGNTLSYVFDNKFFVDTYGEYDYNYSVNNYYNESHTYSNYRPLTAGIPYIVRFPGNQYYEFDLSSAFYNNLLNKSEQPQTVTFNAYGTANTEVGSAKDITIHVTGSMATTVSGSSSTYSHTGTFSAKEVAAGIYGMNADGSAFDDNSTYSTVMPFRTFITSPSGNSRRNSVIYISETTDIEQIVDEERRESGEEPSADYLKVRAIGENAIKVESTYATNLHVFTSTGQLYRILDVCPGTATYSGFQPGIYLFGTTKLLVK